MTEKVEFGSVKMCNLEKRYGHLTLADGTELPFHADNACKIVAGENGPTFEKCRVEAPTQGTSIAFVRGVDRFDHPFVAKWAYALAWHHTNDKFRNRVQYRVVKITVRPGRKVSTDKEVVWTGDLASLAKEYPVGDAKSKNILSSGIDGGVRYSYIIQTKTGSDDWTDCKDPRRHVTEQAQAA